MIAARRRPDATLAGFALLTLAVYATALTVVGSPLFPRAPGLGAFAVTFDLTVAVPLLFWLLVVRRGRAPAITLVPVSVLGVFAASRVLPADGQQYLRLVEMAVIPAELGLVAFLAFRARAVVRHYRALEDADVLAKLKATLRRFLPAQAAADVVACEAGSLYYALFSWRARPEAGPGDLAFTYHRKSGYAGLLGAAAFVSVVEMVVVHLLLVEWQPVVAWTLTALSAYGALWIVGLIRSVLLRPVLLAPDGLHVRLGMMWSVRVPYGRIASVEPARPGAVAKRAPGYLHAVPAGAAAQTVVTLAEPVEVDGLYGYRKKGVERIGIFVDDAAAFRAELAARV